MIVLSKTLKGLERSLYYKAPVPIANVNKLKLSKVVINLANRRAKVTCSAIKKNGEQCKQTVGIVNGFCSSHRPTVEEPVNVLVICKYQWTNGRKCDEVAVKDGFCHLHRPDNFDTAPVESNAELTIPEDLGDLIGDILNHTPEDKVIDLPTEDFEVVEDEERPVKDAREYFEEISRLEKTGDLVEPSDIFAKYDYLMKYVSMDAVANLNLFAAHVVKVAGMTLLQCAIEFKSLKSKEDELSAKSKQLTEEAHQEYGRSIPLDVKMDIDTALAEVVDCKNQRAVVMAAIEYHESQMEDEPVVDDDTIFPDSLEERVKQFFGGLWNKVKGIVPQTLMAFGVILVAIAIAAAMNMGVDKAPAPKAHTSSVAHHKSEVNVPVPVVDNTPTDNVVARHNAVVAKPAPVHVFYTVKKGDTLWTIAKKTTGNSSNWSTIYQLNKDKLMHDDVRNVTDGGHWIHAGEVLDMGVAS